MKSLFKLTEISTNIKKIFKRAGFKVLKVVTLTTTLIMPYNIPLKGDCFLKPLIQFLEGILVKLVWFWKIWARGDDLR